MFEVGVVAHFSAAHRLRGSFGPAIRMHGHTYRLEVTARGPRLKPDGTLVDVARLQIAVDSIVAQLDYQDLGELPFFVGANTTAEVVASFCWEQIAASLRGAGATSLTVRVWESPGVFAARDDDLDG